MEEKTMGKFISALRKANGMTQKDLAERLNVSDKSVSRWERDDGTPDLSLIPVIAEIFGVTCDELLRGERKSMEERANETAAEESSYTLSPKGQKQQQRILTLSLASYRNRSFISIGISLIGLIAAMICNFGFLRAYLGFLFGCVFYAASIVCQAIFINGAFTGISDEEFSPESKNPFKRSVIRLASVTIGITVVLFAATLPLAIFPFDTYMGLSGESWFLRGLLFGGLGILFCGILSYFLHSYLLKTNLYPEEEKKSAVHRHNHKLVKKCGLFCAIAVLLTFLLQSLANNLLGSWQLAEGIQFHDYDRFIHYMEQDIPYESENGNTAYIEEEVTYYDAFGNEIPPELALRETVTVGDPELGMKVVCTYLWKNQSVIHVEPAANDTGLPITVLTQEALAAARQKNQWINYGFFALYGLELFGAVIFYLRKRIK